MNALPWGARFEVIIPVLDRQECQECGRGIPPRRRDTGFCSSKCEVAQRKADEASAASEREYLEGVE